MEDKVFKSRHSLAHILAMAVLRMFPEAKLGTGPAIETGFYYDFLLPRTLIPEDLPLLEEKMKEIIKEGLPFEMYMEPVDSAIAFLEKAGQEFKKEIASDLKTKEGVQEVSFYKTGEHFVDLCEGPHVENTRHIDPGAFMLDKIAGAYFRGDETRPMMQRIYGLAFGSKQELKEYVKMREEAKKRDHRKLGKELDLFAFDDEVGPGLPLWLPKGAILVEELEKLAKQSESEHGYDRVRTPHITKGKLYERSGHLPYYKDDMFPPMELDGESYYLKPMNCPHHHKIYAATPKSYRDLPLRYAEYGHCYRYEDSGALFGLMRVRSLCMNDAHIYCTPEQFEVEFMDVIQMYLYYFKIFGIEKYQMQLSKHSKEGLGKKYVNEPKLWIDTEAQVRNVLKKSGVPFIEVEDEAAFYGPKIDVQIWSVIGREFTLATNQLDFAVPAKFHLTYTDSDGVEKTPLCIHRAPLSTHERFIGFLIEHFAGAFPLWLAPVQVAILPVAAPHEEYARDVQKKLQSMDIRATIIGSEADSLGKRIRSSELMKIPYAVVIGDKEVGEQSLTARSFHTKEQTEYAQDAFIALLKNAIDHRVLPQDMK